MGSTECIVDKDVTKGCELFSEPLGLLLGGLELLSVLDTLSSLSSVESKVIEKDDFSVLGILDSLGDLITNAVWNESNRFAKLNLES